MRWSILTRLLLLAVSASLILAACGGGDEPTIAPTSPPTVAPTAAPQATVVVAPTATARPAPTATPVPPPTPTSAPVSTGQMTIALSGFANFEMVTQQGTTKEYLESMYDYVIGAKENGDLDPATGFVSAWTIDPDGKGFTFKTRPSVLFHNGDTATSKDIIAFIELARAPASQWSSATALRADIVSMDTPDDNTLNVKLTAPSIFWHLRNLSLMGSGGSPSHLLSGKYLAAAGYAGYNKTPVGTGPYKFKSAAVNDNLTVEAVDKHWLYGVPRTKTMVFRAVPEETTRLALLRAGDADIIPISRAGIKAAQAAAVQIFEKENSGVGAFRFEAQFAKLYDGKPNPIANYEVIKALGYYGVDRETIVKTFLQGRGVASIDYPSQPLDYGYIKQPLPAYDPVKAKDLLAKAGYPNGFDLDFIVYPRSNLPEGTEIMEAVIVGWEKIGIKINRQPSDFVSFQNKIFGRAFGDNGAFNKPTVSGMWYLGASPTAGATAASSHTVGGFNVNYDADIADLGKKWQAAITLDDYKKYRTEYMKLAVEKGAPTGGGMTIFTVGLLYAGSPKVPAKWDIGSGQDARNYQKAAGWRY